MDKRNGPHGTGTPGSSRWYDLFSRGARDWLRHDEKVRASVRENLPNIIASGDVINTSARTVRVPVRMLEHYHFRLREADSAQGVGQGAAQPGDVLAEAQPSTGGGRGGGRGKGELEFLLELKVDDIVDWLWEELKLPNLNPRGGNASETEWVREGWDRHGARSRLDRRRSMRELLKRRGNAATIPPFIDADLRYRQLARRQRPAVHAVVFFALDVSGSMSDADRKLAKTFFFWVVQGLRREYRSLDTVFIAHTTEAWEFTETEFFQVAATGGTVASTAFGKIAAIIAERFDSSRHNIYTFYASDGDNAMSDADDATRTLKKIADASCYTGYVEIASGMARPLATETGRLFSVAEAAGLAVGSCAIESTEDIWDAVRHFFASEQREADNQP